MGYYKITPLMVQYWLQPTVITYFFLCFLLDKCRGIVKTNPLMADFSERGFQNARISRLTVKSRRICCKSVGNFVSYQNDQSAIHEIHDFFIKLLTVKLLILETIKKRKLSSRSSLNISLPSVLEDTTSLMEDIQLAKCDIYR